MTSHLELNSRAALCRQLAKHEPANQALWMAEAESWSRLSKEKLRGEAAQRTPRVVMRSTRWGSAVIDSPLLLKLSLTVCR